MKYFSPSYWFKLWVLSAPLFNDKTQGINAKSIDNKKIKDWASKNTSSLESINQDISYTNSSNNYQPYNLHETNQNINPIYQTELETNTHKHRHEKSRRIKKQVTPHPRPYKEILKLNQKLIINQNQNNRNQYQTSFQNIINELIQSNIFLMIPETDNQLYIFNTESNYDYFRLPVRIIQEQNEQSNPIDLELVLSTDALYIQGFIITSTQTYYYFNADLGTSSGQYNPQLEIIPNMNANIRLNHIGNAYRDLIPENNQNINWNNIYNSFLRLTENINIDTENRLGSLALSLGIVILMTAEPLRFRSWHENINNVIINNNNAVSISLDNNDQIYRTLVRWGQFSQTDDALLLNRIYNQNDEQSYQSVRRQIYSRLNRIRNTRERNFMNDVLNHFENTSIETVTRLLFQTGLRVFLFSYRPLLDKINRNCNNRGKRDAVNKFWYEKFCDLKPQIDKIQGKITAIKILDENTKGGNLEAGTIYVGTENGVYLIYPKGITSRFNNLNFPIKDIILDGNGSAYVINEKCEIYHLNLYGWGSEKQNMESCDLNKELKLYYNNKKDDVQVNFAPVVGKYWKTHSETLNLSKISPLNYRKIEFLGDIDNNCWGTMVNWGSWVYTNDCAASWGDVHKWELGDNKFKSIKTFLKEQNNKFHNIIENTKNQVSSEKEQILQKFVDKACTVEGYIDVNQRFGLTWYWENENYYIKIWTLQYCNWKYCSEDFNCNIKIGNGIRLYNDDYDTFENQIPNPNDRKRREIYEEKNENKWTDDYTKSINHEQHLPIDNKPNFSTSNITSL